MFHSLKFAVRPPDRTDCTPCFASYFALSYAIANSCCFSQQWTFLFSTIAFMQNIRRPRIAAPAERATGNWNSYAQQQRHELDTRHTTVRASVGGGMWAYGGRTFQRPIEPVTVKTSLTPCRSNTTRLSSFSGSLSITCTPLNGAPLTLCARTEGGTVSGPRAVRYGVALARAREWRVEVGGGGAGASYGQEVGRQQHPCPALPCPACACVFGASAHREHRRARTLDTGRPVFP